MTATEILKAMSENGQVAEDVLNYLDHGMWDEWDAGLDSRAEIGWGPPELAIAARAGWCLASYHDSQEGVTQDG